MNNEKTISKQLVLEKNRLNFLPNHVNNHFYRFENVLYYLTKSMCYQYNGGRWDFYELSNGGFFIAPESDNDFEIYVDGNAFNAIVSPEALGIIVTLFSINAVVKAEDEALIDKYYSLRDFALQHEESDLILMAID